MNTRRTGLGTEERGLSNFLRNVRRLNISDDVYYAVYSEVMFRASRGRIIVAEEGSRVLGYTGFELLDNERRAGTVRVIAQAVKNGHSPEEVLNSLRGLDNPLFNYSHAHVLPEANERIPNSNELIGAYGVTVRVDKQREERGIGTALIKKRFDVVRDLGAQVLYADVMIKDEGGAEGIHQKLGCIPVMEFESKQTGPCKTYVKVL